MENLSYVNEAFEHPELPPRSETVSEKPSLKPGVMYPVVTQVEKTEPERGQWSNQLEFILSTVGYAVGLGNVWRFPYLAYVNGGGSFLIPYTIMLLFAGLPLFFMELALGQYSGQGPTRVYGRIAPAFKGLGFAMVVATAFVGVYYNVIMAWTLFYMFSGFQAELPWANCTELNSPNCGYTNSSVSPPEDYFNYVMLGLDESITWSNFGTMSWKLVREMILTWTDIL